MKNLFSILRFPFLMSIALLTFAQTNVALSAPLVAQITTDETEIEINETLTLTLSDANGETDLAYDWAAYIKGSWRANQGGTLSSSNTASTTWTPPAGQTGVYVITGSIRDAGTRAGAGRQNQDSIEITVTQVFASTAYAATIISDPGDDKTYGLGDTITVAIKNTAGIFTPLTVTGTPQITIKMDPKYGEKIASYTNSSPSNELHFNYTIIEPNFSPKGIAIIANSLNGGTITFVSGGGSFVRTLLGVNHDPNHKVDWRIPSDPDLAPTVQSVNITSDAGTDKTYGLGDKIVIAVEFDQKVITTALPSSWSAAFIDIDFDLQEIWGRKTFQSVRGSGTTTLEFEWVVRRPNFSSKGVAILANTLRLRNGFAHIRNEFGVDAILTNPAVGPDTNHKVNWQIPGGTAAAPPKPKGKLTTKWATLKK